MHWSKRVCGDCEFKVSGFCRESPPERIQIDFVKHLSKYPPVHNWSSACSKFKEKENGRTD